MGREARRAQQRAERRAKQQQSRQGARSSAPSFSAPATPAEAQRRGSLLKPRWALDIISELRKVTWPTRGDVAYLSMVVIVIAMIVGTILGGADLFFGWLIEQTILR
jgi:preprotein translocase SecE subunit